MEAIWWLHKQAMAAAEAVLLVAQAGKGVRHGRQAGCTGIPMLKPRRSRGLLRQANSHQEAVQSLAWAAQRPTKSNKVDCRGPPRHLPRQSSQSHG